MKLNEKCMKDILEHCADNIVITDEGQTHTLVRLFDIIKQFSKKYEREEVLYSLKKLIELNYVIISDLSVYDGKWHPGVFIHDVTFQGHKYLENFDDN